MTLKDFKSAIYWHKQALASEVSLENGGFVNQDACRFLPALQLCVCYSKQGDILEAYKYHQIAKQFRPDDEKVRYNETYFKSVFEKSRN